MCRLALALSDLPRKPRLASIVLLFLDSAALLLAFLVAFLFFEILAALVLHPLRETELSLNSETPEPAAVIVPAHNESAGILSTLNDIRLQLRPGDRLLVVADNCSDDTAFIAAKAGAEVVERNDLLNIGKGYALEFAIKYLSSKPPAVVVIIDADCRIAEGTLDRLVKMCATTRRPVQALDLMTAPEETPVNYCVAEFAWRVKNWVRPLGLNALNLPCQLMGTGMAFPWEIIRSANLGTGSVVEDLKLGLELAEMGTPPLFCPSARVTSPFPLTAEAAMRQRKRWEGGHINLILSALPRLIPRSLARRNFDLLVLTLDLAIPPVSMLAMFLCIEFFIAGFLALFGLSSLCLIISFLSIVLFGLGIFACWVKFGRDVLPPSAALSVATYVLKKIPLYFRLLSRNTVLQWTKTDRNA